MIKKGDAIVFFSWLGNIFSRKTKWKNNKNKLVERLSRGKTIKLNSRIIVAEGQNAIITGNGKMCDVFYPGDHTLTPATLPKVNKVCKLSKPHKNFRTKKLEYPQTFHGEIIYVNTKEMPLNFTSQTMKIKGKNFGAFRYKIEYEAVIIVDSIKQFGKYFIPKISKKDDKYFKKHIQNIINADMKKLLKSKLEIEDIMFDNSKLNEIINAQAISLNKMGISLQEISIKNVLPTKRSLKKFNKNMNKNNFELYYYDSNVGDENVDNQQEQKEVYILPSREEIMGIDTAEDEETEYTYPENDYIQDQILVNNDDLFKQDNQTKSNICPNCRAELFDGAIFCHKCGIKLESEEDD